MINSTALLDDLSDPAIQTYHEEVLNTFTHSIGFFLSTPAVLFLISVAKMRGTKWHLISCIIYGISLLSMFFCSSLYHSVGVFRMEEHRAFLKNVDHSAIYLLIAGTYTPLTMINLIHNNWNTNSSTPKVVKMGWLMLIASWTMCVVGVLCKMIVGANEIPDYFSNGTYLFMGWLSVLGLRDMITHLPRKGMKLLVAGGLAYTSGICFMMWETTPFNHAIWHVFVGAGSLLHYFCILECIIPAKKGSATHAILDNIEHADKQDKMAFFGSQGYRQRFIVRYMRVLYRAVVGWASRSNMHLKAM
ncbi:hypothetical protein SAMD00019534_056080 [Acytostelium subglobosum LB1]|uniref:hypothetical protein n=1 Tax=Acytostelium subglobosum LB1 TaxID=1410327 RepID=UPI000644976B|nr:hypothetical protein SAMD00019534_056080 [Acytostelium subglobosum LB1]GAM22433.1 hypothetical protein SAMD00019534_056080 [Acytostelium subglobosum LB1]|eukprot:XP_012754553.1 hypothetical protein SAMD00019534_056080 [Acytostelium subglobosum LB1]